MGSVFCASMTPTLRKRKQSSSLLSATWWPGWVWAEQGLDRAGGQWASPWAVACHWVSLIAHTMCHFASGYTPYKVTYASDYFDQLYAWAIELICR